MHGGKRSAAQIASGNQWHTVCTVPSPAPTDWHLTVGGIMFGAGAWLSRELGETTVVAGPDDGTLGTVGGVYRLRMS